MPEFKTNLLLGAGAIALTQTLTLWGGGLAPAAQAGVPLMSVDDEASAGGGGEGGGEGGGAPSSYALNSTDPNKWTYDAGAVIAAYAAGVKAEYDAAAAEAAKLQAAIDALLADPSQATLDAARTAWTAARPSYLVTEAFRFYDGPIEAVEGELNAWPMNEAFVDYTTGAPKGGLINDPAFQATAETILARNQASDEADVTTGWHAIEFLLWGQDLDPDGPGNRPFTDYVAGTPETDKRRAYLKAVTGALAADIQGLAAQWDQSRADGYAARFMALPPREAIGRIVNGIAVLTGHELRSERMAVALDSGDQEDEQSCFSDTTKQDFVYDLKGVETVYYGRFGGADGPGLDDLMKTLNPERAAKIDVAFAAAAEKVGALGDPWDKVLAAPPDSPERQAAEAAVAALGDLAAELKATSGDLGVLVQIPGL